MNAIKCNQLVLNAISIATEAINNIRKHSEVSFLAEEKARETTPVVWHSQYTRQSVLTVIHKQAWEGSKVLEQLKLIKIPGIQHLAEKVGAGGL